MSITTKGAIHESSVIHILTEDLFFTLRTVKIQIDIYFATRNHNPTTQSSFRDGNPVEWDGRI